MEALAEFEQGRDLAACRDRAAIRGEDLGHALEHRALTRAVVADEPEGLSFSDLEGHILQRPQLFVDRALAPQHCCLQAGVAFLVETEALGDAVHFDGGGHQSSSARRVSYRRKIVMPMPRTITAVPIKYTQFTSVGPRLS